MDRATSSPLPFSDIDLDQARSAINWWALAGVDTLIDETPRDWLAPPPPAAAVVERRSPELPPPLAAPTANATLPGDLPALHDVYANQPDLPFAGAGTTRILPSGDPASGLMMLADMPTSEDAASGQIFSGECGLLFDRMLAAIGHDRASIYLATLSCLAAPGGRLDAATAEQCGTLARQHVKLAAPRRVLLLGEAAIRVMTGLALPAARGRMHVIDLEGTRINAVATYHPRYLLQRPSAKAGAWADLQLFCEGAS